jgi:hypothetical protein
MSGAPTTDFVMLRRHRSLAAIAGLGLAAIVVWQAPRLFGGSSVPASPSPASAASSGASSVASSRVALGSPSPVATAPQSATATARPSATPGAPQTDHPWQPDPVLELAKIDGRLTLDTGGGVVILDRALPTPDYPPANALDTGWSGLIQEPPRTGTDDKGTAYTDYNYSLFCGAGTAAMVLYYWPASRAAVTGKSGTFVEPVDLGANRKATTYWKSEGAGGNGRGMIMYLAEVEWPAPDQHLSWWPKPGLMNWSASPPSTNVQNLVDALNWEASGRSSVGYFYVIVPASRLTEAALLDHVHADINMGVPVVIAARTSDGVHSLPYWNVKSTGSAVNHFATVVGYDDAAGTYAVMDTCGTTCNDRNTRAGVANMSQSALYSLILAESDDDGIMW